MSVQRKQFYGKGSGRHRKTFLGKYAKSERVEKADVAGQATGTVPWGGPDRKRDAARPMHTRDGLSLIWFEFTLRS